MRPFPQTQPFHRIELTLTIANQTLPTTILDFFDVQNDFTHYVTALIPRHHTYRSYLHRSH